MEFLPGAYAAKCRSQGFWCRVQGWPSCRVILTWKSKLLKSPHHRSITRTKVLRVIEGGLQETRFESKRAVGFTLLNLYSPKQMQAFETIQQWGEDLTRAEVWASSVLGFIVLHRDLHGSRDLEDVTPNL